MSPKACTFCHRLNQYICNAADHCGACDTEGQDQDPAGETAHNENTEAGFPETL